MKAKKEHPILVVAPRANDLKQKVVAGFGEPKELIPVNRALRRMLVDQLGMVGQAVAGTHAKYPELPTVITLRLRTEAMAKSNRPMQLLERVGMLPIGTQGLGELLLPATTHSLSHLASVISDNQAKGIRANISTIESFTAYGADQALQIGKRFRELGDVKAWIKAGKPFVLERFSNTDEGIDALIGEQLQALLRKTECRVSKQQPAMSRRAQFVEIKSLDAALTIAAFPGVRSVAPAEEFSPIRITPQWFVPVGNAPAGMLPAPPDDLPVVAVVDTGVDPKHKLLKPWLAGRETYVLPADTDYLHGSFVAGLVAGSRAINGGDTHFPAAQSRILDIAALATTGNTTADEMINAITESLKKHPEVKVWNCSFGSRYPGDPDEFGQLARELDALSDKYGVLFVIAAGNFDSVPLRAWPNPPDFGGKDRISLPAESVRGLTVGSVAHVDAHVAAGSPSPFSRRGPGPAKTPKPDITHRGGNQDVAGNFGGAGVCSLLPDGRIGESIGTSFATPLAATLAANAWQVMEQQGHAVRPDMVKALMIHAAALSSPGFTPDERNYHGTGVPDSVMETLFCRPDTFTLLFDAEMYDGVFWEKTPFPIPACLHPDGTHFKGEIILTLVYAPPVDGRHGAEYIRANVNAHFGSYDPDADGVIKHHGIVPLDTPDKQDLYEAAMIDHGFKWSPVKVYRARFRQGKAGCNFRLYLELLRRAGEARQPEPQRAIVLVSMRGISDDLPVYNDGIRALRAVNWTTSRIATATRIRV